MKLLLTGANGFIGKVLCQQLLAKKNTVVAPVRASEKLSDDALLQTVEFSGLKDDIDWIEMLKGVDVIIHLASRVHVMNDTSDDPLAEFRIINVDATLNLARQAAITDVKRFIYISSIKVNGEQTFSGEPFKPDDTPNPIDPYGVSKYEAEKGLLQLARDTDIEIVIIRPPLVYGPGVKANFQRVMKWLYKGVPLPFGSIHNARSLVSLDNLIDLILTCIDHSSAANEIFLVSDGEDLSTTELLTRITISLGKKPKLLPINQKLLELILNMVGRKKLAQRLCGSLQVDISKAKQLLNWTPPFSFDNSLIKTVQYFKSDFK